MGILYSKNQQGNPRFPTTDFMKSLAKGIEETGDKPRLSAHLCGRYVRDIVERGDNSWVVAHEEFWPLFERIQLNFHGQWHKISKEFLELLPTFEGKQVIFQVDGVNDMAWAQCQNLCDAVPFFDASHGAGVKPTEWPKPFSGVYNGYSGGLGPHGLGQDIKDIAAVVGDAPFWIDMETRVRSDSDMQFDLKKVEDCLIQAAAAIIREQEVH